MTSSSTSCFANLAWDSCFFFNLQVQVSYSNNNETSKVDRSRLSYFESDLCYHASQDYDLYCCWVHSNPHADQPISTPQTFGQAGTDYCASRRCRSAAPRSVSRIEARVHHRQSLVVHRAQSAVAAAVCFAGVLG